MDEKLVMIRYRKYDTIFIKDFFFGEPNTTIITSSIVNWESNYKEESITTNIKWIFTFKNDQIENYENQPESLTSALTKIGGMIAILRLSVIFQFLHKK